jgi:hypothetical protein
MTSDKNSLSFGRYLQAIRLEKGIELESVSRSTRIGMNNLLFIEQEDHNRLPAEVFVKGFLRAYSKAIGVDGDEVVQRYLSGLYAFREKARLTADLTGPSSNYRLRLFQLFGILLCIVVLSVFSVTLLQGRFSKDDSLKPKPEDRVGKNSKADAIDYPDTDSGRTPPENIEKQLFLRIITVEDTWIKIIIDDQSPKEYSLKPGDRLDFEASSNYNLLIGNAGGVELSLDDRPIEVPGKSGHVVNIQIPGP